MAVSFDDAFDAELAGELGDLGPGGEPGAAPPTVASDRDRGGRGRDDRGDRRRGADVAIAEPSLHSMTDLRITQLDSGLTVATELVPAALSVATGVWVGGRLARRAGRVEWRQPLPRAPVVQGHRDTVGAGDLRAVDRVGGDFNAFTAKEYTAYYMPPAGAGHVDVRRRAARRCADRARRFATPTSRASVRSSSRSWRWTTTHPTTSPIARSRAVCSPITRSVARPRVIATGEAIMPALRELHPAAEARRAAHGRAAARRGRRADAAVDAVLTEAGEPPPLAVLRALPPALARLVMVRLAGGAPVGHRADEILALGEHGALDVGGGLRARIERGCLEFVATPPVRA